MNRSGPRTPERYQNAGLKAIAAVAPMTTRGDRERSIQATMAARPMSPTIPNSFITTTAWSMAPPTQIAASDSGG